MRAHLPSTLFDGVYVEPYPNHVEPLQPSIVSQPLIIRYEVLNKIDPMLIMMLLIFKPQQLYQQDF